MLSAADIREWMKKVMVEHDLSVHDWAKKAGVSPSTIFRAIKDDYAFVTSSRTLAKLAAPVGALPPRVDGPLISKPSFLPIRYQVGAGQWRAVDDMSQVELGVGTVSADPAYEQFAQWMERVVGDSMDLEYKPGTLLHVVDTIDMGFAPRAGDHVIIQRSRDNGDVERTVKEVAFGPHGIQFISRSSNPRWANHPIVVTDGGFDLDHCEVEIVGLVLGSYLSRRPA